MHFLSYTKKHIKNWLQVLKLEKNNESLILGENVRIQNGQYISFGKNCVIGDDSKLLCTDWYNGKKLNTSPQLIIGNSFHATRNLTIQCAGKIIIGNDVLMASDIFIIDYNHGIDPTTANYLYNNLSISKGITISDGVWVGNNVIILGGVRIGKKAIIGAGSVITKNIPPYSIAVGNPAKVIKVYDNKDTWIKTEKINNKFFL